MKVVLSKEHLRAIEAHGESTYPNEGAGFMLGQADGADFVVEVVLPITNKREAKAQHNRYELSPKDFMQAELEAARREMSLIGVFHSHPDHPARPSDFDREHAWPNFSYLITAIDAGKARITRAWRLHEDRAAFDEDTLETR